MLFLVPRVDPNSFILLPKENVDSKVIAIDDASETKDVELVSLVHSVDGNI